jgi:DNA mismatch endonuclease (patch repair protein)
MVDIVNPKVRSQMMAGIRGRNTKPEMRVRQALHRRGFRFALTDAHLPGRPDVVLTRWKVAVFVHGCFWHWHGCSLSKLPGSNSQFWERKLAGNVDRDQLAVLMLVSMGWRVVTIWECALRSAKARASFEAEMDRLAVWIRSAFGEPVIEIALET